MSNHNFRSQILLCGVQTRVITKPGKAPLADQSLWWAQKQMLRPPLDIFVSHALLTLTRLLFLNPSIPKSGHISGLLQLPKAQLSHSLDLQRTTGEQIFQPCKGELQRFDLLNTSDETAEGLANVLLCELHCGDSTHGTAESQKDPLNPRACQRAQLWKRGMRRRPEGWATQLVPNRAKQCALLYNGRFQITSGCSALQRGHRRHQDWNKQHGKDITGKSRFICLIKEYSSTLGRQFIVLYHSAEAASVSSDDNHILPWQLLEN